MSSGEQNTNPSSSSPETDGTTAADGAKNGAAAGDAATPADPQSALAKANEEKRELNDRLLRTAAEFENYKRRVRKEMEDASLRGLEGLAKELLPALDNFDRALAAAKSSTAPGVAVIVEGVQMVQKSLFSALEKYQIKTFEAEGKPFDPNFHEGIQQVDSDTVPQGSVATVFQRGYTIGSRLLRPAMVAVSRGRANAGTN